MYAYIHPLNIHKAQAIHIFIQNPDNSVSIGKLSRQFLSQLCKINWKTIQQYNRSDKAQWQATKKQVL